MSAPTCLHRTAVVQTAIRSVRNASHQDITGVLFQVSAMVKNSGALSESCKSLLVDGLDDFADHVDDDLVSQQMASDFDNRDRRAA